MIQIEVQKNLICLEDLLLGVGTVNQTRGQVTAPVTKINGANFPYDLTQTMKQRIDALQADIDSLPAVVDGDGNLLVGLLNVSAVDLTGYTNRMWVKTIDANKNQLYFDEVLMLEWDPTAGNLITSFSDDYIAADSVVTSAFQAADDAIIEDYEDADTAIGFAYAAADTVVTNAFIAADVVVTNAFIAADEVLDDKIDHRVSVTQQPDIAASTVSTKTVVYTDGSWTKVTVTSNFTFAFTFPASEVCSMMLEIVNGGAYIITWPVGMKFPGGIAPALTASGTDHVVVYQDGNGVRYASVTSKDVK